MIHHYLRGTPPRYSSNTDTSDPVDARVSCESPRYEDKPDGTWIVVGVCEFTGSVPVWSDGSTPVWECPRCGMEHREEVQS